MAAHYVAAGNKVQVITTRAALAGTRYSLSDEGCLTLMGVEIFVLPVEYDHMMGLPRRIWAFLRFWRKALKVAGRMKGVDLVLAYSPPLSVADLGRRIAGRKGLPLVLEIADMWPEVPIGMGILRWPPLIRILEKMAHRAYLAAVGIAVFSEDMKRQLGEKEMGLGEKTIVVPNGINVPVGANDPGRRDPVQSEGLRLIYAGTLGRANGLGQVLEAAKWLQEHDYTDVEFTLLGAGNRKEALQGQAGKEGLKQVHFLPAVSREQLPSVLRQYDVGIGSFAPYPVLEANGSAKFFDYLACGLPVILNYQGWQAQVLAEAQIGLSSAQGDIDAFVANVLAMRNDLPWVRKMGLRAREWAVPRFQRDHLAGEMLTFFETILASS